MKMTDKSKKRTFDTGKGTRKRTSAEVSDMREFSPEEKRRAEKDFRESEDRFQSVFESSVDAILLTAPDGTVFRANPAACEMFGYTEEEICRLGRDGLVDGEDPRLPVLLRQRSLMGRAKGELNLRRKDGTIFPTEISSAIFHDAEGNLQTSMVIRDLTDRKRAEDALRASEARYREILENVELLAVSLDAEGNIVFCNDFLLKMIGWSRTEVLGRNWFHTVYSPKSAGKALSKYVKEVLHQRVPVHPEVKVFTRDGTPRLTKWTTTVLHDPDNIVIGSASIGEDVTETRRAQEALRESKETLEAVFDAITESVVVADPAGNVIAINETCARRLGGTPRELIGRCLYDLLAPDVAEHRKRKAEAAIGEGKAVRFVDQRDGAFLDMTVYPVVPLHGDVERVVVFARDITEQQLSKKALLYEKRVFQALCEQSPFGMAKIGKEGEILYVNRKFEELLGYQLRDVPTSNEWFQLAYPDLAYRAEVMAEWSHYQAKEELGDEKESIFDVTCKDGSKKTIRFWPAKLESGEYLMTVEDISQRLRTEAALRQSDERFRAIFEAALDCIFIKDTSFRYTHVNPAMERLLGMPASQIIGHTFETLFPDSMGGDSGEVDRRVLQGESVEEEHTISFKGVPITFSAVTSPILGGDEEIVGVFGIARDITDRKRAEETTLLRGAASPGSVGTGSASRLMSSVIEMARVAAKTDSTILLLGESGTGKDYLAHFIHNNSKRVVGPYLIVNCASVAGDLADSELFGHEQGAFTGAGRRKRGLLELAEGGTLLLNELGELSQAVQAKLLTFLDTRELTRVGGEKTISVNTRLLAATNKDLGAEVAQGRFRKDLFYRLNVISIELPPLRDRTEDLPILVRQILSELSSQMQLCLIPSVDPSVMDMFATYEWPGNIRELRNVLERAIIVSGGSRITPESFSVASRSENWSVNLQFPKSGSLHEELDRAKRLLLIEALRRSNGNRTRAARLLGISRYSVINYIKSLGLTVDEWHTSEA